MELIGYYYLCDAGYPNGEGLLTPYRGQRYHLSEWRSGRHPETPKEFFNYKHSSARNVIERCFGILKGRWGILRGHSYYPVKVMCRIISACALLHNHIKREMPFDPFEQISEQTTSAGQNVLDSEAIIHIESSTEWTNKRDAMAEHMFAHAR